MKKYNEKTTSCNTLPLFFSSCFYDKEQSYQQDAAVELDTLDIEQVKIETH